MKQGTIYPSVKLFGLEFFQGSVASFMEFIAQQLAFDKLMTVCTPNPEQIVRSESDSSFRRNLYQFDVCVPDGVGVSLGARFIHGQKLERIAGVDIVSGLLSRELNIDKILIIGGREYDRVMPSVPINDQNTVFELTCATKFYQTFWTSGYRDLRRLELVEQDDKAVKETISLLKPDVVLVALGAPFQEEWVIKHQDFLIGQKVRLAMVVGGAFDILFGAIPRSPKLLRQFGLEWFYRLIRQPWRWRRQLKLVKFPLLVLDEKFKKGSF